MLSLSGPRSGLLTSLCKLRAARSVRADRRNTQLAPLERGGEAVLLALEKARVVLPSPSPLFRILLPLPGRRDAQAARLRTRAKQLKFHLLHLLQLPVLLCRAQSPWQNRFLLVMELYSGLEFEVDRRSLLMRLFPLAEAGEGVEGVAVAVVVVCSSYNSELGPLAARGR